MKRPEQVRIPQDIVNDEFVLIRRWCVPEGAAVVAGDPLVEAENSKAVFEIPSPAAGFVRRCVAEGAEAAIGAVLCELCESANSVAGNAEAPVSESTPAVAGNTTRFSRHAQQRVAATGTDVQAIALQGLVRAADIDRLRAPPADAVQRQDSRPDERGSSTQATAWHSAAGVPYSSHPLPRAQRIENHILRWSLQEAVRSEVTIEVPTLGAGALRALSGDSSRLRTVAIIGEAARLLREYPQLNACCLGDEVRTYESINAGVAMDSGSGLRAVVIHNADTRSPAELLAEHDRLLTATVQNTLKPQDLTGATFTLTDLSGAGVRSFAPLIPEGQAMILAIAAEVETAGGRLVSPVSMAFDHRLASGRIAAQFLNRLGERLQVFERGLVAEAGVEAPEPCCARCGLTVSFLRARQHALTATINANWSREWVCTICLRSG
jgi:pyruvate dehydrogenase E2 component (dihydrolipoamide acetyltransferase)